MGYFAVLAPPGPPFGVEKCHLNFWVLNAIGGYRYYLDVGLNIAAGGSAVTRIQLALPFETADDALSDLTELLTDQKISNLIFGVPTNYTNNTITFQKDQVAESLRLVRVLAPDAADGSRRTQGNKYYSLWDINLSSIIPANEKRYFRIRFKLKSASRTWSWRRDGALLDMRFSDIREAVRVRELNARAANIVQIDSLNLFLIAPTTFELRRAEPNTHYMRLLESNVWEPYLRRKSDALGTGKLVIHQWRSQKIVSADSPLRVYALMRRRPFRAPLLVWVCVVLVVGFLFWQAISVALDDALRRVQALSNLMIALLGTIGILTIAKTITPLWNFLIEKLPRCLSWIDKRIYKELD